MGFNKLIFLFLITACVAAISGCVKKETPKPVVNKNIQQVNMQNTNTNIPAEPESAENGDGEEIDTSKIFAHLSERLLKKDHKEFGIPLYSTPNFFITTSILSNKKDKIVYSEISDCIGEVNKYGSDYGECDWQYNIFVKDIKSGSINRIYSHPRGKLSWLHSLLFTEVKAGGCSGDIVYFPIVWSKNDQKIILEWGVPTSCGSGGKPQYLTYALSPNGGKIENLSTYSSIFFDDYGKVIYTDRSDKSPSFCGPGGEKNSGKIVLQDIETGKITILAEDVNSYYALEGLNDEETVLTYSVSAVKNINEACSEVEDSTSKEKTIDI